MGIVFNTKDIEQEVRRHSIKKQVSCPKRIIQHTPLKVLTPQNKQFLKNLGLKIIRGKSTV